MPTQTELAQPADPVHAERDQPDIADPVEQIGPGRRRYQRPDRGGVNGPVQEGQVAPALGQQGTVDRPGGFSGHRLRLGQVSLRGHEYILSVADREPTARPALDAAVSG